LETSNDGSRLLRRRHALDYRGRTGWSTGVLIGALLAIAIATLAPGDPEGTTGGFACVFCGDRALADFLINVILYMPLGVGLAMSGVRLSRIVLAGVLLSSSIEAVQVILPGRDASVGDVIANTLGTGLGALIVFASPRWLRPSRLTSNLFCLSASALAVATLALTGYLLGPSLPTGAYSVIWTPAEEGRPRYGGAVVRAAIGDISLRPARVEETDSIRAILAGGARMEARIVVGPPPPKSTALVLVRDDLMRKILALGVDRHDFVVSYRTRAADFQLDQPDVRWVAAMDDLMVGDTTTVRIWGRRSQPCMALGTRQRCGFGFTVGSGWTLLFYAESFPNWLKLGLTGAWVAGLLLPVGFWFRRDARSVAALVIVGVGLAVIPASTELVTTLWWEWIAAVVGVVLGLLLRRAAVSDQGSIR